MLRVHRRASEFGMANRDVTIETAVAKLGMKREALEVSMPNVELNWQMTPEMITRAEDLCRAHAEPEADPRAARLCDLLRAEILRRAGEVGGMSALAAGRGVSPRQAPSPLAAPVLGLLAWHLGDQRAAPSA